MVLEISWKRIKPFFPSSFFYLAINVWGKDRWNCSKSVWVKTLIPFIVLNGIMFSELNRSVRIIFLLLILCTAAVKGFKYQNLKFVGTLGLDFTKRLVILVRYQWFIEFLIRFKPINLAAKSSVVWGRLKYSVLIGLRRLIKSHKNKTCYNQLTDRFWQNSRGI